MTALLALFLRSMRVHLRAKSTYLASFSLVAIIFVLLIVAQSSALVQSAPGLKFFELVMMLNLVAITLVAVSYFASAITEEKEEGTIGLLQMTDLNPLAILLGKSTTRLCGALLLLGAQIPFTLLAATLGGIAVRQIFAAYITLAGYTFFLANLALLASVLAPRAAVASILMTGAVVFTPAIAAGLQAAPRLAALPHFRGYLNTTAALLAECGRNLAAASPFRRLNEIMTTGFQDPVISRQFWAYMIAGSVCFGLAWLCFDRFTGDSRVFRSGRIVPRPTSRFRFFAPGRAWLISAIAWKDFEFLHGGRLLMTAKTVGYGLIALIVILTKLRSPDPFGSAAATFSAIMGFVLAIEAGLVASRMLREEVRNKTLVGLASLPFAMKHAVLMKLDGARRALLPAFGWTATGLLAWGLSVVFGYNQTEPVNIIVAVFGIAYGAVQIWLFAHVVGYLSLRMKFGALPFGLGLCLLGNVLGGILCFGFIITPIVALIAVPALRESIYLRLETMAGED